MDSWCKLLALHFTFSIINILSTNLVSQSHSTILDYTQFVSAIVTFAQCYPRLAAHVRPPASSHRPLASDWGPMRLSVLCSLYMNIWLVLVFVYTTQKSKSLDYPSQDRLPNWQSGAPQPLPLHRMHACTPRTVAAVLTQLLGHIRPFTGGVLFIFWVRIVLGN